MRRRTENLQSIANPVAVVQVRSIEGELQQHAVAGGLDDPAPWLASVSVFIAQFLFGNIPNLPATLASSVENVA